jgi:hypothetical protein
MYIMKLSAHLIRSEYSSSLQMLRKIFPPHLKVSEHSSSLQSKE